MKFSANESSGTKLITRPIDHTRTCGVASNDNELPSDENRDG